MRSGRLVTKMAMENEVELEPVPAVIPSLPDCQHVRVSKSSLDQDLVKTASEQIHFERFRQTPEFKQRDPDLHEASVRIQEHYHESVANENVVTLSPEEECEEFVATQAEKSKAKSSVIQSSSLSISPSDLSPSSSSYLEDNSHSNFLHKVNDF